MNASQSLVETEDSSLSTAHKLLGELRKYRRVQTPQDLCQDKDCISCARPHLDKIVSAIKSNKPLSFVLPAFPGKSPNPEKVLSPLPDYAERLSLRFLSELCLKLKQIYSPGARIILCSDGRVFSDVVGMKEEDVSNYQREIERLIKDMSLSQLSTFHLDDHYKDINFNKMREQLMFTHGDTLASLQEKVRRGASPGSSVEDRDANRMYTGITRFLFEDALHEKQSQSKTALQKEARTRAYEVIRRSNAWSELIAKNFPQALRLSIHPQGCGSKKLGLRLIGNENWMTPWHGVAVKKGDSYILLKRSEAESLGAQLLYDDDGRPSHYLLHEEQILTERRV